MKNLTKYKVVNKEGFSHLTPYFYSIIKSVIAKKIEATGKSIREAEKNAAIIALKLKNEK